MRPTLSGFCGWMLHIGCELFRMRTMSVALWSLLVLAAAPADPRLPLLDAMAAELSRSQTQLKLGAHEAPYFISYQMKDYTQHEVVARYGALFQDDQYRDRKLFV